MHIVLLTPGTGNFYCGNCLRDNALANELRAEGHDVKLIPLYLPHVVDEPSAAADTPIFYGGVSIYLEQKLGLWRYTPRWLNRMLNAAPLLRRLADYSDSTSAHALGEMTLSMLHGEEGRQNVELTVLIDYLKTQGPIDVICLSNALLAGLARRLRAELGAPVVCTLAGEDAFLDSLPEPHRSNAWQTLAERAADIDAFIAVSRYYGQRMRQRLDIDDARLHVVYNGINLAGFEPAERPPDPPALGYLARLCEEKGLEALIDAFVLLKRRDRVPGLKLRAAGAMTARDRPFVERQRRRLAEAGLDADAEFLPNVSHTEKQAFLRSISVLSVPAVYGEAFGLYVIEAWACGVPVVQPRHAAFIELIETHGGGVLCEPNDPQALADAAEILLLRGDEAQRLGGAARRTAFEHFSVERMARQIAAVFENVLAGRSAAPAAQG